MTAEKIDFSEIEFDDFEEVLRGLLYCADLTYEEDEAYFGFNNPSAPQSLFDVTVEGAYNGRDEYDSWEDAVIAHMDSMDMTIEALEEEEERVQTERKIAEIEREIEN